MPGPRAGRHKDGIASLAAHAEYIGGVPVRPGPFLTGVAQQAGPAASVEASVLFGARVSMVDRRFRWP
jgi:hypothetical protein